MRVVCSIIVGFAFTAFVVDCRNTVVCNTNNKLIDDGWVFTDSKGKQVERFEVIAGEWRHCTVE